MKWTPAGISLSRSAKQIVADMDKLIAQTLEAALLNRSEIRIGMIDSFSATVGPYVLNALVTSTNRIPAWSGLAYSHANGLLNRQVDLIISSDTCDDMDGLVRTRLHKEQFLIVVPKQVQHRFNKLDLSQCMQEMPFIRFSARSHYGSIIERHLRCRMISAPHFLELDTADVVMAMVASGLGWAITSPLCLLQGKSFWGDVAVLPLPGSELSRTQVMRHVILPASMAQIISGFKIILGLSWTCVISAELVAAKEGLGFMIMNGKEFFQTDTVVLGMVMISVTVLVIDVILRRIENKVLAWQR